MKGQQLVSAKGFGGFGLQKETARTNLKLRSVAEQQVFQKHIWISGEEAHSFRDETEPTLNFPPTPAMLQQSLKGKSHREFPGEGRESLFKTVQREMKNK